MSTDLRRATDLRKRPGSSGRRKKSGRFWKGLAVVILASAGTTLAIHASDTLRIPGFSLLGAVGSIGASSACPDDMTKVLRSGGVLCVDKFENAPGRACTFGTPRTIQETEENIRNPACVSVSAAGHEPWTNVTLGQAQLLCARSGKRLPTGAEWYQASIGTPDDVGKKDGCALGLTRQENADPSGAHARCVSASGVYDMVGNVWEWVDGTARDGVFEGHNLPPTGYVQEADESGIPAETSLSEPSVAYGGDHASVERTGIRALFRGGYWGMDEKAGVFAINATQPPSFVGIAVGFRCVK